MAKSKQTQAKEISIETKRAVLERQGGQSISWVALSIETASFHHYISRGSGGVGYEWNIIALTPEEHRAVHDHQPIKVYGRERYTWSQFKTLMRNHLIINYEGWSEDKCKYQKYLEKDEYGVRRRKNGIR